MELHASDDLLPHSTVCNIESKTATGFGEDVEVIVNGCVLSQCEAEDIQHLPGTGSHHWND